MEDFRDIQKQWAMWLRNPDGASPPANVSSRRLQVYSRLVRNNIESFIERGFPVLAEVLSKQQWQSLLQSFIEKHNSESPLFANIGDEFVNFLETFTQKNTSAISYPDFIYQLACYERMEVEVYHAEMSCVPPVVKQPELSLWRINPSLQWRDFNYPVHTIQPQLVPNEPLPQPIFIAVYRVDCVDENKQFSSTVKFMQLNPVTMLLIDLLQRQPGLSIADMAVRLSEQLPQYSVQQLEQGLLTTIPDLYQRAMLFPFAN
ncbi:DNA-binding domain-containing protein [Pseudidiomarina donghaiensis]|uniref:HvfC family RiPP maturation protein n=1 Tax=Pseudidiomarina donghaiensis TaxID=519452 RepID=UPI003A9811CB